MMRTIHVAGAAFFGVFLSVGCWRAPPVPPELAVQASEEQRKPVPTIPVSEPGYTDELQGTWLVETFLVGSGENVIHEVDGLETSARATFGKHVLSIVQVTAGKGTAIGVEYKFNYSLDATKNPKQMDLEFMGFSGERVPMPATKTPMPAIFELDADTLRIAISTDSKRPETLSLRLDSEDWQLVFRRNKP
jgi:uncharacterized protein (TIGR03067 family)